MELMEAIKKRRSVRKYTEQGVERSQIERIIEAAVQAPSAMNTQPWGFVVIRDREKLRDYSDRARRALLSTLTDESPLARYRETMENPEYDMFYGAPVMVVIYINGPSPISEIDCCLAAENLMLAACDTGLGTCWIGFSINFYNLPEVKAELGVPEEYRAYAPIVVGHPQEPIPVIQKNPPKVIAWM